MRAAPEAILREIFTQAFAGAGLRLPPGTTKGELRAALALDQQVIATIFLEVKAAARREQAKKPSLLVGFAAMPVPENPASENPASENPASGNAASETPAPAPRPAARRVWGVVFAVCLAVVLTVGYAISHKPLPKPVPVVHPAAVAKPLAPVDPAVLPTAALFALAPHDPHAAAELEHRAALGEAQAEFDAAVLQDPAIPGGGAVKNAGQAAALYLRAAALGYHPGYDMLMARALAGLPAAEDDMGTLYDTRLTPGEQSVTKNDATAFHWYLLAADMGYAPAEERVALAYLNGRGVAPNPAQELKWTRAAAAAGIPEAEFTLGQFYHNGGLVSQNDASAARWYARAAALGEANAQNSLGYLYYNGSGVPQNYAQAFLWFHDAALQGLAAAEVNVAICYYEGNGTPADLVAAARWLLTAQAQGDGHADDPLQVVIPKLSADQLQTALAEAKIFRPAPPAQVVAGLAQP